MYFAILAFLMLAVAHAAPLDFISPTATPTSLPSIVASNPVSKHTWQATSPLGTKTTRSIPMVMQARAPETLSHSQIEKIHKSMIVGDEGRKERRASPSMSARAYKRRGSESRTVTEVGKVGEDSLTSTSGLANDSTSKSQALRGTSSSNAGTAPQDIASSALHQPRAADHSSDKFAYPPVSSISSRQLRAPDYSSAGSQSNSTTEENGSHPTKDQETEEKRAVDPNGTVTKRTAPVEWSKNWFHDQMPTGTEHKRAPSDDKTDPTFKIAQKDARSLSTTRSGDGTKVQDVSA
ncbi:hypothetical protein DFS33DRAFT_102438 [Desarmillaria ectypa]|nr:hypothetical protein DFS33DRAFT_102438 [Desarmillaria ectypa]